MKNEFMNEIAKIAQEKFEIAKQLILEEMQDVMNEVDSCECDCECQNIIDAFKAEYDECKDCRKCVGEDEIDMDSDYREISVLVDGENVAVEYDDDMEDSDVITKLLKGIIVILSNSVEERLDDKRLLTRKEIEEIILGAFDTAVTQMAAKTLLNAIAGGAKND